MPAKNKKEWNLKKDLIGIRNGGLITPILFRINVQIRQSRQQERGEIVEMIDREIKKELSAKPADDLEKTAEWYKVSALKNLKSQILNRH